MRRFVLNIIVFVLIPLVLYIPAYWVYYLYHLPKDNKACYLWGDSQMYQDVQLSYLDSLSQYHYYSAANHGNGLYSFLVFAESVPENSRVIIQISRTVLLRRKEKDYNVSALNIKALTGLWKNGYTANELGNIIRQNLLPQKIFNTMNSCYSNTDTVSAKEPLSLFTNIYKNKPAYFENKEKLYLEAIKKLNDKKCKIIALSFPYNRSLINIEGKSAYKSDLDQFDSITGGLFIYKKTITLKQDKNIFADLTHLNQRGAQALSVELSKYLDFSQTPLLIKVYTDTLR